MIDERLLQALAIAIASNLFVIACLAVVLGS